MDKHLIQNLKNALLDERHKLEDELKRIAERNPDVSEEDYLTKYPQFGDEMDENAEEVAVFEQNIAIEKNLQHSLRDINSAIERIEAGTYGICKYCGKEIDEKRLEVRPASSACMKCKARILKR